MNVVEAPSKQFMVLPGMSRHHKRRPTSSSAGLRIPLLSRVNPTARGHVVAMIGEFFGTFMFLFFAFAATNVANASAAAQVRAQALQQGSDASAQTIAQAPQASTLLYISLAFGFSLAVNVWIFFRISGGLFNPAVILAMALIGSISWMRAGINFIAEIAAGIAAAAVVSGLFPGPLSVSVGLDPDTSVVQGLFIEMFLTAELVFTIFMLAVEKHQGNFLAPMGIGLALFIAELAGVYYTGGSLNPARSFGPAVITGSWNPYQWIYWIGPMLGSLLAVAFYRLVKMLEYETANPDDDAAAANKEKMHRLDTNGTAHTTGTLSNGGAPMGVVAVDPLGGVVGSQTQLSPRLPSSNGDMSSISDPQERAARQV